MTQKYAWGPFAQQADPIVSGRLSTEILARFPDMAGLGFDLRRDGAMAELLASGFLDLPFVAYNVRSYGAIGDGVADDTLAFNDAISTCNADGGGAVVVPVFYNGAAWIVN